MFLISLALDIVNTNVSRFALILPQPSLVWIYSKAFLSSLCKAILKTNSNPIISPSVFLRTRHMKLDSASLRPTNHSINSESINSEFNSASSVALHHSANVSGSTEFLCSSNLLEQREIKVIKER